MSIKNGICDMLYSTGPSRFERCTKSWGHPGKCAEPVVETSDLKAQLRALLAGWRDVAENMEKVPLVAAAVRDCANQLEKLL